MTNQDLIKQMSTDCLADFLASFTANVADCAYCPIKKLCFAHMEIANCEPAIKLWLESEATKQNA